jgi:hypothetical protein
LADTEIVGGLQTVADTTARDTIPSDRRKEGMLAYSQADDRHFVLEGGLTNSDWKEFGDDNRLVGGLQTVADTTARDAIPVAKRKEGMIVYSQADEKYFILESGLTNSDWVDSYYRAPITDNFGAISISKEVVGSSISVTGEIVDGSGLRREINFGDILFSAGNRLYFWQASTVSVTSATGLGGLAQGDVPLFFVVRGSGGVITKVVPCFPMSRGFWLHDGVTVGYGGHFDNIRSALVFCLAFAGVDQGAAPRRVVFTSGTAVDPPVMTGTVGVSNAGTSVTGSGTKFLSEFRTGDLIRIQGFDGVEVFSVASDTSLTLSSAWPHSTQVGAGIEREWYAGPNGYSVDTDKEEFSTITDLGGMQFIGLGGMFSQDANERPTIGWGPVGLGAGKIDPLFNFRTAFSPKNWSFVGLNFNGVCTRNVADDTQALFRNIREGWSFQNCHFHNGFAGSTTVKMTNLFLWDIALSIGSDADEDNDSGLVFDKCVFHKAGGGIGSAVFKTINTLSGSARLNDCKFHGDETDVDDRPDWIWDIGATASTVGIIHDGGVIRGVRNGFFRHTHASASMATAPKTIKNIRFGATGTFFKLVDNGAITAGARCSVYDCQVANNINMEGCHLAVGLRSTAGTITIPAYMLSIGCEYFSVSGSSYGRGILQAGETTSDVHRLTTLHAQELYSDDGIRFQQTPLNVGATENNLAVYEEGTWTPALNSTGATFTYGSQNGRYTRIGRSVTITFNITLTNLAGAAAQPVFITGIPFATSLAQDSVCLSPVKHDTLSLAVSGVCVGSQQNSFSLPLYKNLSSIFLQSLQANDMANTTALRGSLTYILA